MTDDLPKIEHRYDSFLMDSGRWQDFKPRDHDIIISTPYKAGTTWTQRICALLIFQSIDLDRPVARISPWLDGRFSPIEEVLELFEQQTHRRFIKSHTPLNGLPYYENVTYLVCGRDPRDIFISMENHYANLDMPRFIETLSRNGGVPEPPPVMPEDVNERFQMWLMEGVFEWESDGFPFGSVFDHLQSFWRYRDLPNIQFLHYSDLQADLDAEMRRLASILQIEVDEEQWPEFVRAATFTEMKRNVDQVAPNTDHALWRDPSKFFNKGVSGQWREALSEESLALYEQVKDAKLEASLAEWIDRGFPEGR